MNREQAKRLLPILQAWAEGKELQRKIKQTSGWSEWVYYNGVDPAFDSVIVEWRIKPEIKEGWINIYFDSHELRTGYTSAYKTKELADKNAQDNRVACIKIIWTDGEGLT